jgi:hypothetical protein
MKIKMNCGNAVLIEGDKDVSDFLQWIKGSAEGYRMVGDNGDSVIIFRSNISMVEVKAKYDHLFPQYD